MDIYIQVHMEAERKAMLQQGDAAAVPNLPFHEKITYKVGNKVNPVSELICFVFLLHCNPIQKIAILN